MKDNSKMDIHMASDTTIQDTYNLLDNSKMDNLVDNAQRNQLLSYLSEKSIKMGKEEVV